MNKEKYTSLELSKKIYELAKKKEIELESEYCWTTVAFIPTVKNGMKSFEWQLHKEKDDFDDYSGEYIPALDTAELGMILPDGYTSDKTNYKEIEKKWCCGNSHTFEAEYGETEAEARGKMYFYLLDNNLL